MHASPSIVSLMTKVGLFCLFRLVSDRRAEILCWVCIRPCDKKATRHFVKLYFVSETQCKQRIAAKLVKLLILAHQQNPGNAMLSSEYSQVQDSILSGSELTCASEALTWSIADAKHLPYSHTESRCITACCSAMCISIGQ